MNKVQKLLFSPQFWYNFYRVWYS